MTHAAVTRALIVVLLVLGVAALLFGAIVRRTPPSVAADAADESTSPYATYCGSCHTLEFSVQYVRNAPTVEAGGAALARLLRTHGDAPESDQAAIVAAVTAEARR